MELHKDNVFFGLRSTMTEEQEDYVQKIISKEYDIIFVNAAAGTGKTTMAVAAAKFLVESFPKKYKGLLYLFNPTEENEMGYRPGNQEEKEIDYLGPLKDALTKVNENPMKVNHPGFWVKAKSHTFLRGTNLEEHIVILDEAQNWTISKLKKTLTRIHDSCKTIVMGHVGQCDLPNPNLSGFEPYIKHYQGQERAAFAKLTKNFRGWVAQHADTLSCD